MNMNRDHNRAIIKGFAYIYLSRSDDDPRPRRDMIERKASQSGIELAGEFIDYGQVSGEVFPEFGALLTAVREHGDISAVVVPRLGHTHNHMQEALTMYNLQKLGVVLVSASDTVVPTPFGYVFHQVSAALCEAQYGRRAA